MRASIFIILAMTLAMGGAGAEESPQIQQEFGALDRNGDGSVTHDELLSRPDRAHQLNLIEREDFVTADVDENGRLDLEEFSAFEAPFDVEDD